MVSDVETLIPVKGFCAALGTAVILGGRGQTDLTATRCGSVLCLAVSSAAAQGDASCRCTLVPVSASTDLRCLAWHHAATEADLLGRCPGAAVSLHLVLHFCM